VVGRGGDRGGQSRSGYVNRVQAVVDGYRRRVLQQPAAVSPPLRARALPPTTDRPTDRPPAGALERRKSRDAPPALVVYNNDL